MTFRLQLETISQKVEKNFGKHFVPFSLKEKVIGNTAVF